MDIVDEGIAPAKTILRMNMLPASGWNLKCPMAVINKLDFLVLHG